MQKGGRHPSDQDLLLAADGELSFRRAAQVRSHLFTCWQCRMRMAEFEGAIADFVRATIDPKLPPADKPREALKAKLAELTPATADGNRRALDIFTVRRQLAPAWALAAIVILAMAVGTLFVNQRTARQIDGALVLGKGLLPNPNLTPGSTRPATVTEICAVDHDEVVRTVPGQLQRKVFQEYGIANPRPADYELDYLITPGLGGADDIRNLWPEPHDSTTWNSYAKDQLEDRLHNLVCGRQLSLSEAQHEIASNWISAYKKYFHTNKPLPNRRASSS